MAYQPPSIGPAGLSIPAYQDILANLIAGYQGIFGLTTYLGIDSADYQFISIISLMLNDAMQGIQLAYNARSPVTAIGSDLDGIVKLNGLVRLAATYSIAQVNVVGAAGATITNGVVRDVSGFLWSLPSPIIFSNSGTISVSAVAQQPGNITAQSGEISFIQTPTAGWISVTNPDPAIPGLPFETDSNLRARQALSVALPSQTLLAGTIAAIEATPGVLRQNVDENATGSVNANGNPAHSITAVVEGGTDLLIATAIYNHKGIGAFTNGTTTVPITDPFTGAVSNISFKRPTFVTVYVIITIHGLAGFTSATVDAIQLALVNYLNSLAIGEEIVYSELYGAALTARPDPTNPLFSIKALFDGTSGPVGTVSADNGGSGYTAGDILSVAQSGASGLTVTVNAVSGGVIISTGVATAGTGYTNAVGLPATGGTGSGATITISVIEPTGTSDIAMAFDHVSQATLADVLVVSI